MDLEQEKMFPIPSVHSKAGTSFEQPAHFTTSFSQTTALLTPSPLLSHPSSFHEVSNRREGEIFNLLDGLKERMYL
jgi:hypothetical protein